MSYRAMSVTPGSGAHETRNDRVVRYAGSGTTWDPGRTVSTIVQVSFPPPEPGPGSRFPARSSATVANSYVPSPTAVKEEEPKFEARGGPERNQPALFPLLVRGEVPQA